MCCQETEKIEGVNLQPHCSKDLLGISRRKMFDSELMGIINETDQVFELLRKRSILETQLLLLQLDKKEDKASPSACFHEEFPANHAKQKQTVTTRNIPRCFSVQPLKVLQNKLERLSEDLVQLEDEVRSIKKDFEVSLILCGFVMVRSALSVRWKIRGYRS